MRAGMWGANDGSCIAPGAPIVKSCGYYHVIEYATSYPSSWRTGSLLCACKLMSSDISPFLRHMLITIHSFALPVECADFSAAFKAYCYCRVMECELLDKSDRRILLHTVA